MTVHQWLPAAHRGDAVGDSAVVMRALLRAQGHDSEIFALEIDADMQEIVQPFRAPDASAGDVTIFHFATPSPLTDTFSRLRAGRVLQYHNITPARYFALCAPDMVGLVAAARRQVRSLASVTDVAVGPSEYNRRELAALGFRETGVLPLAVDVERLTAAPAQPVIDRWLDDGRMNVLFVGRVAPNKKIEDLLRLVWRYRRRVDANVRLLVVGRYDGMPRYFEYLVALASRLGLDAESLVFTGPVPDAELAACYRAARVYVSMSEHEGFCAPLVEAMAMNVPILAYSSTAVPETLGGAGVEFAPKDLAHAAELLRLLACDDGVRASIIEGQRRRLAHFSAGRVDTELRRLLERFP
jgi:glycosyltransferase involved in cell wall biosynthesis